MTEEKILVVEDEAIIAAHLARMLTNSGYRVLDVASSGQEAISMAHQLGPDLILMDIQLRGEMDGIEATGRIHLLSDVPVIYLTAFADDKRVLQASHTLAYGYLIKPVHERELRATVQMALERHKLDRRLKESELAYRHLYHNTPAMLHTIDSSGRIIQVSDYWLAALHYTREEVIGSPLSRFLTTNSRRQMAEEMLPEFHHSGAVRDFECQFVKKGGQVIDTLFSMVGIYDEIGNLLQALSAVVDITARKRAEAAERYQRTLAEAMRDTAAALNSTLSFEEVLERVLTNVGRVVHFEAVNIMLAEEGMALPVRCLGYDKLGREDELRNLRLRIHDTHHLRLMAESGLPVTLPDTSIDPYWNTPWVKSYAGAPIIIKGSVAGFINLISITPGFYNAEHTYRLQSFADQAAVAIENARLYAEVERLATLDELTGVSNRRKLFEMGRREFDRALRYQTQFSVILLDLDRFKKINDTFGHPVGDRVLAAMASLISRSVREVDLFGRYGGEEFVILLPDTSCDKAQEVAERLRLLVSELSFKTERGILKVTVSLGVATLASSIPSLAVLIDHADQAMYTAKQAGRNRVAVYPREVSLIESEVH
jgi:diguanylate cyclase (GGDEF)-like protein/PAS domain S-box-containing protein